MRLILQLLLICALAAGVGLGLTAFAMRYPPPINLIQDGPWAASAGEGTPEVDAYTLALIARRGEVTHSISDGLTFRATQDDDGNTLSGNCIYLISGNVPNTRTWSLAAFDAKGGLFANPAARHGYTNADVQRDEKDAIRITLASTPRPGDWIPVSGNGAITLVLRLYDTTAAAISGGRSAPELPSIKRVECRS